MKWEKAGGGGGRERTVRHTGFFTAPSSLQSNDTTCRRVSSRHPLRPAPRQRRPHRLVCEWGGRGCWWGHGWGGTCYPVLSFCLSFCLAFFLSFCTVATDLPPRPL